MKNKLLYILITTLSITVLIETQKIIKLSSRKKEMERIITEKNQLEQITLEDLVKKLKVYTVFDNKEPIKTYRHGKENDGGYIVPEKALLEADGLLGYGIADDISFEEQFSNKYDKPSYGFDCGVERITIKNKKCHFISECIANDSHLYGGQKSSGKFSTFADQLKKTNLENKKVFIKMDIEGAEYAAFEEILKYGSNITGIVLEIHFLESKQIFQANKLLDQLQKDFYLIHVHANNCPRSTFRTKISKGEISKVLELTFINKNLTSKAVFSEKQNFPLPIDMENCQNNPTCKFEILK